MDVIQRARRLRRETTIPERILWAAIRNRQLGVKFRRQHPIGVYVCDFYCHEARLVVELDGLSHASWRAVCHDGFRDLWLSRQGLTILRIANANVIADVEDVVLVICRSLHLCDAALG